MSTNSYWNTGEDAPAAHIDHVTEAVSDIRYADEVLAEGGDSEVVKAIAAVAQVHATLALVEQQRIANRIALARVAAEADRSAGQHHSAYGLIGPVGIYDNPDTPGGNAVLQDDIREGLGL